MTIATSVKHCNAVLFIVYSNGECHIRYQPLKERCVVDLNQGVFSYRIEYQIDTISCVCFAFRRPLITRNSATTSAIVMPFEVIEGH